MKDREPHLDEDALSLLNHVYSVASEILQRDQQVLPVAFFRVGPNAQIPPEMAMMSADHIAVPEAGSIVMLPLRVGDEEEKNMSAAIIRAATQMLDADLMVQVSESWVVKATNPNVDMNIPPRMHPDRMEAVVLFAHKRGGRSWTVIAPIQRDSKGKPSVAADMLEPVFSDEVQGRFAPE